MSHIQELPREVAGETRHPLQIEDPLADQQIIQTHLNDDGSTSNYFDKRKLKIAPRSTLQFKVGPPFELVGSYNTVLEADTLETVLFQINPRIDRGFDFIDDGWVGYKRNYFTLVSSFETPGLDLDTFLNSSFKVQMHDRHNSPLLLVKYFAVKIRARSDDDRTEISLVQHTAKRDKGPQFTPATCPLIPSALPQHQIIREASNVRNSVKMRKYDSTFFFHRDEDREKYNVHGIVYSYPDECIQKVARYERVQFASSINVKKPSQQNKHFRLHVVLGAVTNPPSGSSPYCNYDDALNVCDEMTAADGSREYFIPLQEMKTPPLIIRGRSPSNYTSSQKVAVRTSSSVALSDKNSTSSISPVIISPRSSIPPSLSPPEQKTNRSSKRRSKVSENPPSLSSLVNAGVGQNEYRTSKRVETIEHIERLYKEKTSLSLRTSEESNRCRNEDKASDMKRPKISRQDSIDPKEIELKPPTCGSDENIYVVGSLALTATFQSDQNDLKLKRRRVNKVEARTIADAEILKKEPKKCLLSPKLPAQSSTAPPSPRSPIEDSQGEESFGDSLNHDLHSISLSILDETSSNYRHDPNYIHSNHENIARSFPRVIGETSFTNLYVYKHDKFRMKDRLPSREILSLPSQVVEGDEFYQEISFYRH
ncbi:hypothetical protein HG536_0D02970 [Torulaspora globosa]|uniref:NDT80 domain-containing protein n=1 Tax=Torulaspora globosa TaxID=48254 RepID=A0A7G3ZGY9_9SACH|nr:uncharacterized protein HG536_0D02970 [Torulaspora globosa]QLL32775.1 hypothetical protein HG536_0D02970 [Torulaspora globosa]